MIGFRKNEPAKGTVPVPKAKPIEATPNATPNKLEATPNRSAGRKVLDERYRKVHRADRSNYMRDYMRKRREKAKAS